jgi:AbrB family looped-hinge helix DNA binding protein
MATTTMTGGAVPIPGELRERFGLADGSAVTVEEAEGGIILRPLNDLEVEIYTPERMAEFFLNNAIDATDYEWAVAEVRRLGIDPSVVPHDKPPGVE